VRSFEAEERTIDTSKHSSVEPESAVKREPPSVFETRYWFSPLAKCVEEPAMQIRGIL
jgi:hypothetical protein